MGLILDSSIVIAAERRGDSPRQLLRLLASSVGNQQVVIPAIALTEIVHAVYRAPNFVLRSRRELFIQELLSDVEVVPYTRSTAFLAGKLDGEQRSLGITVPSMDLLIGATAIEIDYPLVTVNLRHFQLIPGLRLVTL